ncbi:MAG: hypothetical protein QOE96_2457 [Blastocatellia bacterium]|jgi:tetratricopeptide (TPR) repeat protein|nr:hypothetical protein [Blastocatellia bacterium]
MPVTDQITSAFDELRLGETSAAIESLGSTWRGIGKRPPTAPTQRESAQNLLLCGMLSSKLGAERKTKGAQEAAKDLLNESLRLFTKLRDPLRAKAQIELALCYWRSGEINEAVAFITDIQPANPEIQFEAKLTKALFEREIGKIDTALDTLKSIESSAEAMPPVLRGQFHQQRAVALRRTTSDGNLDRALVEYEAALVAYEEADCFKGEAMVRNNLATVYREFGDYQRAHFYAAKALRLFTQLGSQHLIAEAEDQRALIFLAEGNYSEAARLSRLAAAHLQDSDQKAIHGRTLITLGRSLARMGQVQEAREELERAAVIFEHTNDPVGQADSWLSMIEELPLPTRTALEAIAHAGRLITDTYLADRFRHAATKVGKQLIGDDTSTFADLDQHVVDIKSNLVSRVMAKHGGANARGAVVRAANELGITHTGLLWFLNHHKDMGHKKRPRRRTIPFETRSSNTKKSP